VNETFLLSCIQHMTIASYLHPKPDVQIKRMAKRYLLAIGKNDKLVKRTLRNVVKTSQPALLVQIAYNDLMGQG